MEETKSTIERAIIMPDNPKNVKLNVSTNSKGLAQIDVTVEFKTVEESLKNLDLSIAGVKVILNKHGLKMASC